MPEPTPSTPEPIVQGDDAVAEPRSTEVADEQPKTSLWNRIFGGSRKESQADVTTEDTDAAGAAAGSSKTIMLTAEELERRVQSETDRREAKRTRESVEQKRRDLETSIEKRLDPTSAEYDPYAAAEERARLKAEDDSAQQLSSLLGDIGKQHDAVTLDVIVAALPEPERDRIFKIEGAGVGLDGRKLIVNEGLKALEKHWKTQGARDAERKLREDPVFRKRVFSEHRGDVDEPELVEANGSTRTGDPFMNRVFEDYHALKGHRR